MAGTAEQRFAAEGIADRCRFVGGSCFEEVWAGGDIYLLSSIIHDWDDGSATKILANCREAIRPDGRLLILDVVLPASGAWHPGKVLDIVMLALTTGRERTETEWTQLLEQTGSRSCRSGPRSASTSSRRSEPERLEQRPDRPREVLDHGSR